MKFEIQLLVRVRRKRAYISMGEGEGEVMGIKHEMGTSVIAELQKWTQTNTTTCVAVKHERHIYVCNVLGFYRFIYELSGTHSLALHRFDKFKVMYVYILHPLHKRCSFGNFSLIKIHNGIMINHLLIVHLMTWPLNSATNNILWELLHLKHDCMNMTHPKSQY